jgi:hypothetical protein
MMEEKKGNSEQQEPKAKKPEAPKSGSFMKELLSGTMVSEKIILKNIWYVLLITFLTAFYIGNRFHAEKVTRELSKLQRQVRDLRSESLSTSADLMYLSRQSEVYRLVKERGLSIEELKTPPYKLIVSRK